MKITLSPQLVDRINDERFEELLRKHRLPVSGLKGIRIARILEAVNNTHQISLCEFDSFLAEEVCHGKSRTLFIHKILPGFSKKLLNEVDVRKLLVQSGIESRDFNELRQAVSRDGEWSIYYSKVTSNTRTVEKIDLCFVRGYPLEVIVSTFEGEQKQEKICADYVWVTVLPLESKLIVKIWEKSNWNAVNNFDTMATARRIAQDISNKVIEMFRIKLSFVPGDFKTMLYRIFKDLTETAEKPFKEKVEILNELIEKFTEQCVKKLSLPDLQNPICLPSRVARLLERALIQNEFERYKSYFSGKIGVVERVNFSDQTGAYVNARSGEDGMAVADIYFDTRDTLDELKMLDKLWINWFYIIDGLNKPIEIETKIETYNDYYIVHFSYGYTTKEVENYVLSNIKRYEEISC